MKRSDEVELNQLKSRDPRTWSVAEVAKYLDIIGLGEYKISFIENDVSGAELVELTADEAQTLGVRKLGHRKTLMSAIQDLSFGNKLDRSDSASDSGSSSGVASEGSRNSNQTAPAKYKVKAKWDGRWIALTVDKGIKFSDLKKKLRHETRTKVACAYTDSEGDLIEIRRSSHLKTAFLSSKDGVLRLTLTKEKDKDDDKKSKSSSGSSSASGGDAAGATAISASEGSIFEGLKDGVVVIDEFGKVIFVNTKLAAILGAVPSQLIGQNVKVMMLAKDAESHDFYLWRYVSSRDPHIVGKPGRLVIARKFDGTTIPVMLTVNEAKSTNGKLIFVGTLVPTQQEAASTTSSNRFALMDAMLQGVVAIDTKGTILYVNRKMSQMSGYEPSELVGRNVNCLMPSPYKENHDGYLKRYQESGDAKIIGVGRDVLLVKKDHSIVPVNLNVNVSGTGADINYVGVFNLLEETRKSEDNLLAAQRQVLDSLPVAAVLIDSKGTMQVFNAAAQKMFGFSMNETLGRNVNMLMPEPEKSKHDSYLRSYLKNGRRESSTVIGAGRDVIGQKKSGDMISVHLSVTEHIDATGNRFFSAILQ